MSDNYVPVSKKMKTDEDFQLLESLDEETLHDSNGGFVDYQKTSFNSSYENIGDPNNTPSTESGIESGDRWDFVYEELQVNQSTRNDEIDSSVSDLSDVSDLSNLSGRDWKPTVAPLQWVQKQMNMRISPRDILKDLIPDGSEIPEEISDCTLWKLIINYMCEIPQREPLSNVQKLDDVLHLLRNSNKIMVLTGAGVSVSCGIPDFRSRDGVYARLSVDFPDLPDPQAMFDIHYFRKDPRPFFKFAKEIYPGQFEPSIAHKFIRLLEKKNKLLRNFTQNIDTLEQAAGISNVIQCHGSFAKATCMRCKSKFDADFIKEDIFNQRIPYCPHCPSNLRKEFDDNSEAKFDESVEFHSLPIIKPDIVFFGEGLPQEFHSAMAADKDECDLLIVIGSSLKVRPVALIPSSLPGQVPQILINRESLKHLTFDVELLGDCDVIIRELCHRLGEDWEEVPDWASLKEIHSLPQDSSTEIMSDTCDSNTSHPIHDDSALPHPRISLSKKLPDGCFLHVKPNKYIFPGAEINNGLNEQDDEEDDHDSDHFSYFQGHADNNSLGNNTEDSSSQCFESSDSLTNCHFQVE